MTDRTQGDLRLFFVDDGSDIDFFGGQPVMDQGLTTAILISLFTDGDWIGNAYLSGNQKIGGRFEKVAKEPIQVSMLNRLRAAAQADLRWLIDDKVAKEIDVRVSSPKTNQLRVVIRLTPPTGASSTFTLSRTGATWAAQYEDPYREE